MKFVRYLDNRWQELGIQIHAEKLKNKPFSVKLDAQQNAAAYLLATLRFLAACCYIPGTLFGYLMVQIGRRPVPAPALDILAAQAAQMQNKKGRKVGFQPKPVPEIPTV